MHLRHITSSRSTRVSWWVSRPEGGQLIKGRPCHLSSWWSTKVWKKASNSQNHIEIRVPQKIYNKQIKIDKHQVHIFWFWSWQQGHYIIIYDSSCDPCPPHIQSMFWPHRRYECLSSAMTVVANPWLKCTSVIGGSGPQVMVVIWTSFIDSSLHTSRNYVQSIAIYYVVQ